MLKESPTPEQLARFQELMRPCEWCGGRVVRRESSDDCSGCHGTGHPAMFARWMELEADRARLDAMIDNLWRIEVARSRLFWVKDRMLRYVTNGNTPREAIDAARAAMEKGTEDE